MTNHALDQYLNDAQFKSYLQYIMGMIYNGNKLMSVLYGEGNNGKSLLQKLLWVINIV
jgi:phage/plasmid-associated DNA primase